MAAEDATKVCRLCGIEKPIAAFSLTNGRLRYACRACRTDQERARYAAHAERIKGRVALYQKRNRPRINTALRQRRIAKWTQVRAVEMASRTKHIDKHRANTSARRRVDRRAAPRWADKRAILAIYRRARELRLATGLRWDVDHIVPMRHGLVCGLHCEANLEVIPADENQRKSNRRWPNMP